MARSIRKLHALLHGPALLTLLASVIGAPLAEASTKPKAGKRHTRAAGTQPSVAPPAAAVPEAAPAPDSADRAAGPAAVAAAVPTPSPETAHTPPPVSAGTSVSPVNRLDIAAAADHKGSGAAGPALETKASSDSSSWGFATVDAFAAALKKHIATNPGIDHMCSALGLTGQHLEGKAMGAPQRELLEQARAASSQGICIDRAMVAATRLAAGIDPAEIDLELKRRQEEMTVFHGLSQGPFQREQGGDTSLDVIYFQYGLGAIRNHAPVAFSLETDADQAGFLKLIEESKGKTFILSFVQHLETSRQTHVVAFQVDATAANLKTYDPDGAGWFDIPLERAWSALSNYSEESGLSEPYTSVELKPLATE
jgi:hypothetical protein